MIDNEDSVVTSLNELRKLKHERITRQTHSRAVVGAGRVAALAEDPASDQLTPAPIQMSGLSLVGGQQAHSFRPNAGFAAAAAPHGGFAQPAQGYDHYQASPVVQTKTSYTVAVFMSVLLIGGGAAGYVKLQNDTQAVLVAKDAAIKQAEEARNKAVELAAKSDQQSKTNLRQCEDKLKATLAVAPAAPATPTPVAPAVEKKAEKPAAAKVASRASSHKPAARPVRRTAQAEPAAPKPSDVPNIAKKKKLDNDPLAGLGKL
jgi:low affinity Fe/Cu permease